MWMKSTNRKLTNLDKIAGLQIVEELPKKEGDPVVVWKLVKRIEDWPINVELYDSLEKAEKEFDSIVEELDKIVSKQKRVYYLKGNNINE